MGNVMGPHGLIHRGNLGRTADYAPGYVYRGESGATWHGPELAGTGGFHPPVNETPFWDLDPVERQKRLDREAELERLSEQ